MSATLNLNKLSYYRAFDRIISDLVKLDKKVDYSDSQHPETILRVEYCARRLVVE